MLELSTPVRKSGHSLPLLGCAPGLLALRVCGGSHRGRVIQIRSPKCTIGSAAGCTLRLRAAGVRPLHCWILRGPTGTLVRRRSAGTLLNGRTYEDAPLRIGDHLRIGSVELEVVECPASPEPPAFPTGSKPLSEEPRLVQHDKVRELETCLTAANEEIARLEADAQQAWQTSITAAERAEQLRIALEQANVEAGEARGELEAAHAALHAERQQADAKLQQFQQELQQARARQAQPNTQTITMNQLQAAGQGEEGEQLAARVATLEAELEQTRFTLTTAQLERDAASQWEPRFREAEQQVERWQADAQGLRSQNEDLRQRLGEAKAQQARASDDDARRLADQERELNERQRALGEREDQVGVAERRLSEVESRLNQRQTALGEREEQVRAAEHRLAEVQSEQKSAREALERDRSQQQANFEQQTAELRRQDERLSGQAAELAAREAELGQARDQIAQVQAELHERQESLAAAHARLATAQEELTAAREQLQSEREEIQRLRESRRRWAEEPPAYQDQPDLAAGPADQGATSEAAGEPPSESAADSQEAQAMDSVLSRLVQSGLWRSDREEAPREEAAPEPAPQQSSPATWSDAAPSQPAPQQELAAQGPEEPTPPQAASDPPSSSTPTLMLGSASHDEESIETYMERLMQRVRGDAPNPSRPPLVAALAPQELQQPEVGQPQAEAAAVADEPVRQTTVKPEEFVPRSQAPEQSINLAAMREVANSAARSAIQHHHQKQSRGKQASGRLFTAGILFLGSAGLAYWAWETSSLTTAGGAGVALLAGMLWATRGFGRVLHSLKLSRPDAAAPEAPADDAAAGNDSPAVADSSAPSGA
jgi:hypothetical protein